MRNKIDIHAAIDPVGYGDSTARDLKPLLLHDAYEFVSCETGRHIDPDDYAHIPEGMQFGVLTRILRSHRNEDPELMAALREEAKADRELRAKLAESDRNIVAALRAEGKPWRNKRK